MLPNRKLSDLRFALAAIVPVAAVDLVAAQVKSAPRSHFVLSFPDARLALRVPEQYTANVFGCTGRKWSRIAMERCAGGNQELRRDIVRSQ
jgi:hypothetical protein